jgi:hypothetical protein
MGHVIELPDHIYRAIERYAAKRGQSPEAVILEWGKAIEAEVEAQAQAGAAPSTSFDPSRIDNPQFDPWSGMHRAFTANPADLTVRHDEYLAEEYADTHSTEE